MWQLRRMEEHATRNTTNRTCVALPNHSRTRMTYAARFTPSSHYASQVPSVLTVYALLLGNDRWTAASGVKNYYCV